jgi:hypothetical protein
MLEDLDFLADRKLHSNINFRLFCLDKTTVTISFLRIDRLLESYSRRDCYFFQAGSLII